VNLNQEEMIESSQGDNDEYIKMLVRQELDERMKEYDTKFEVMGKQIAQQVALSNQDDGGIEVLEKYLKQKLKDVNT